MLRHVCPIAEVITDHPFNNVTENIFTKIGANLHGRPDHPICIIKEAIYSFFDKRHPGVFSNWMTCTQLSQRMR